MSNLTILEAIKRASVSDKAYVDARETAVRRDIPGVASGAVESYVNDHKDDLKGEKGDPGEITFVENPYDDAPIMERLNDTYTKAEVDQKVAEGGTFDASQYYNKTAADTRFQPKGDYLTEHQDISGKLDKTEAANTYASKTELSEQSEEIDNLRSKYSTVLEMLFDLRELLENGEIDDAKNLLDSFILDEGVLE